MVTIERIIETFEFLPDWNEKYHFLDDLGKKLPPMDEALKNDQTKVHGCMSPVWITGYVDQEVDGQGHLRLVGDSDTPTVKGLLAILVALFENKTPREVAEVDVDQLFNTLGLDKNISPRRHVGMYAMVERIKTISAEIITG